MSVQLDGKEPENDAFKMNFQLFYEQKLVYLCWINVILPQTIIKIINYAPFVC